MTDPTPTDLDPAQVVKAVERMTPEQKSRVLTALFRIRSLSEGKRIAEQTSTDRPRIDRRERED